MPNLNSILINIPSLVSYFAPSSEYLPLELYRGIIRYITSLIGKI